MAAPPLRGSWCSSTAAPLRASWFPPAAAAAASNSARPVRPKVMHINSPVRRDVYPATVRIQARTRDAFRSHCHKGADQYPEPEPEPEQEDVNEHNSADSDSSENSARNNPLLEQLRRDREALRALMGVRVPPDMFVEEKDQINSYKMYSLGADILNANEKALAELACARALTALDLSSKVMDIASSGFGTSEISVHTTNQMVRTYSATFLEVAKDAYLKRLEIEAVIPFLGALRAVCHISIESVLDRLKDVLSKTVSPAIWMAVAESLKGNWKT
ncbi:hypothetical protein BS78_03G262500 [Paspalum vaginatum]|nr:hypothetical protein BS78_03G262500 [Paspalum vaginatum]